MLCLTVIFRLCLTKKLAQQKDILFLILINKYCLCVVKDNQP